MNRRKLCPGCSRQRSTCWVLPCLYLQRILARDEQRAIRRQDVAPALRRWLGVVGIRIERCPEYAP